MPKQEPAQNFLASFEPRLQLLRDLLKETAKDANDRNAFYYNRDASEPTFKPGDIVYMRNEIPHKNQPSLKLQPQWLGPFCITDDSGRYTYKLRHLYTGLLIKPYIYAGKLKLARLNRHLLHDKYLPPETPSEAQAHVLSPPMAGADTRTTTT
jgi:hypothetical protein